MNHTKRILALFSAALLLTACAGSTDNDTETIESVPEVSETAAVETSSEAETSSVIEESSAESQPEEAESDSSEVVDESTELNEDEAALIEQAKQKIMTLTDFVEGQGHMFLIDSVEDQVVQINIRENNDEVASNVGLFRYDAETDTLYEQDILTGEFVEYPANP